MASSPSSILPRLVYFSLVLFYGRVTGRLFTINELAQEISEQRIPEFYLRRFNRQMSASRTRDYLRFLRDIDVFNEQDEKYALNFQHKRLDGEWAQALSDIALTYLADLLSRPPEDLPAFLEKYLNRFYKDKLLPTLDSLASVLEIQRGRNEEFFKWGVYLYTDGETCPFNIRHYPVLAKRP